MRLPAQPHALVLAALCSIALPQQARADAPARSVAVLEYRGGTTALQGIGEMAVQALRKSTDLAVKDGNDARRELGADVAGLVAACHGDAKCLGGLGERLGVVEVLLVGVSEFGDVILTLQRIQSRPAKVLARIAEALPKDETVSGDRLTAYLTRVLPDSDFLRFGHLRVITTVRGAAVAINAKRHGTTPIAPIKVRAPARYDITIEKTGFATFRATVAVPPGGEIEVRPTLARASEAPWYRSWWATTLIGTAVVGAATTAIMLTREAPSSVPVTGVFPTSIIRF